MKIKKTNKNKIRTLKKKVLNKIKLILVLKILIVICKNSIIDKIPNTIKK